MSEHKNEISTARLEAFSDGVFAIAITLLIIEIKVPSHEDLQHQTMFQYLHHQWPKYFAYVLSFVLIGIYWANHHFLFKLFKRTDHVFNLLNVLFLMAIAFFPFPSGVLGEYFMEPEHAKTSVTFYAFCIWLPSLAWTLIWLYAKHKRRIVDHRLTDDFVRFLTGVYILSNFLFLLAFIISFFSPMASLVVCIGLVLLYLLPPRKPEYREDV